ncbi:hypothetical protein EJ110_NYTH21985 [Nymphaea thermarum]|nr:hypothetical protein EJ110_NYTH21985 [Nymphaea thermarum]
MAMAHLVVSLCFILLVVVFNCLNMGRFFCFSNNCRDFGDNLLRRSCEIRYEDYATDLPPAPDVGNYLMTEATTAEWIRVGVDSGALNGLIWAKGKDALKKGIQEQL